MNYLRNIAHIKRKDTVGGKVRALKFLKSRGFRIPYTMALTAEARTDFLKDPEGVLKKMRIELQEVIKPDVSYAIRSSSEREDNTDFSYAGQYKTILNVSGVDQVLACIQEVWDSARKVEGSAYDRSSKKVNSNHEMGVIIQEMVHAEWAGVAFSINPVTGADELIIESVKGSGVKLVQDGKDPIRWIYRHGRWSGPEQQDSPGTFMLDQIASRIKKLKKAWAAEVDLEWVFDGHDVYYVQSRIVTARKFPTLYSNHISREFLPGMIKPLVWSVNIPLVNGAWIRLMEEMLGPLYISPDKLSKSFYYRAYFNMGTMGALFQLMGFSKHALDYLMGRKDPSGKSPFKPSIKTFRYLPRLVSFVFSNLRLEKKFHRWMKEKESELLILQEQLDREFEPENFQPLFQKLMSHTGNAAYFNILIPLVMQLFSRILNKRLVKKGYSTDRLDFFSDFPLLREYDPQYRVRSLKRIWNMLPERDRAAVSDCADIDRMNDSDHLEAFRKGFNELMKRFGSFSESGNDFSYPHWQENPDFVMKLILDAEPQEHGNENRDLRLQLSQLPRNVRKIYRKAGNYRVHREMVSAEYTREYGMFRKLFILSGTYLERNGKLKHHEDVFYLTIEEHNALLNDPSPDMAETLMKKVTYRKKEMIKFRDISLPSIIYGEDPPPLETGDEKVLRGIPTSPGLFSGRIVVVNGYEDFKKEVDRAILVIPFADVGWTPILHRAGAIVSESGGMLSHASIVARELSIPSISSVDQACRLKDGTKAQVDGYNGILILNDA